jgi:hypothetical protein
MKHAIKIFGIGAGVILILMIFVGITSATCAHNKVTGYGIEERFHPGYPLPDQIIYHLYDTDQARRDSALEWYQDIHKNDNRYEFIAFTYDIVPERIPANGVSI